MMFFFKKALITYKSLFNKENQRFKQPQNKDYANDCFPFIIYERHLSIHKTVGKF